MGLPKESPRVCLELEAKVKKHTTLLIYVNVGVFTGFRVLIVVIMKGYVFCDIT
jgi:hypothetical protein